MKKNIAKNGFTLAEVLITLVIIGVVAAITVPTLIIKHQKEETVIRLKKVYSTLQQTTHRAIADNGPVKTWDVSGHSIFAEKYLTPYLNIAKNCRTTSTNDCEYKYITLNNETTMPFGIGYHFYLNDGTFIGVSVTNANNIKYADIIIDINGKKKPNKFGKDVFMLRYIVYYASVPGQTGKFFPPDFNSISRDSAMGSNINSCNRNARGIYCLNVIMKDGWKIADDYPW